MEVVQNYIGGNWVPADATGVVDVTNPATGEVIARTPLSSAADVDRAVIAANAAFPDWRATPPQVRARLMFRLREALSEASDTLARIITTEHGKTLEDAGAEVQRAIENVETAAGIPSLMMGHALEDGAAAGIDEEVIRQPLGVFAAICPFNFPVMVPFWFWPYAVATGNTFIIKPSEQVPLSLQFVFQLIDRVGFPPGVVNLVNGGPVTVDAILDHPRICGVSFVGSTKVARYVYERAAARGKRVQAQGGAKNALVVMPDAALDQTVPGILSSSFGAAGQRCLAGSLVIGIQGVYQHLRDLVVESASSLTVGNGLEDQVDIGPLISRRAQERVLGYIQQGRQQGGRVLLDGSQVAKELPGFFVGPTVFENLAPENVVVTDEIFGPVLGLCRARTLDEAIAQINRSPYGNAAVIFTRDGKAARDFRYRVEAGNIGINVGIPAPMAYFPFGGRKESFFGVLHGQGTDAVEFFTDKKVVITRWF